MNEEEKFGSMAGVVISKTNLLNTLEDNKKKHDALYDIANQNYIAVVKDYAQKCSEYYAAVSKEYEQFSFVPTKAYEEWDKEHAFQIPPFRIESSIPPAIAKPVSYTEQYETAIRRIQLSNYNTFSLSEQEFQSFVMNNWTWKGNFLSSVNQLSMYNCTGSYVGYCSGIQGGYYNGMTLSGALKSF